MSNLRYLVEVVSICTIPAPRRRGTETCRQARIAGTFDGRKDGEVLVDSSGRTRTCVYTSRTCLGQRGLGTACFDRPHRLLKVRHQP